MRRRAVCRLYRQVLDLGSRPSHEGESAIYISVSDAELTTSMCPARPCPASSIPCQRSSHGFCRQSPTPCVEYKLAQPAQVQQHLDASPPREEASREPLLHTVFVVHLWHCSDDGTGRPHSHSLHHRPPKHGPALSLVVPPACILKTRKPRIHHIQKSVRERPERSSLACIQKMTIPPTGSFHTSSITTLAVACWSVVYRFSEPSLCKVSLLGSASVMWYQSTCSIHYVATTDIGIERHG